MKGRGQGALSVDTAARNARPRAESAVRMSSGASSMFCQHCGSRFSLQVNLHPRAARATITNELSSEVAIVHIVSVF